MQRPTSSEVLQRLVFDGERSEGIVRGESEGKLLSFPDDTDNEMEEEGDSDRDKIRCPARQLKFVGIFLAAVSGLFFTLCSVTVKLLPRIDPAEVLLYRALVQMVLTIPVLLCARANPLGPKGVRFLVYLQVMVAPPIREK